MKKLKMRTPATEKSSRAVVVRMRVVVHYANGTDDCKVLLKMTRRSLQLFTGAYTLSMLMKS